MEGDLDSFVSFTGSLLANLNHNNLKYGTEISRTSSFMQGAVTPLTASPNKNLGPEKMILLVCNRACSGHQGKRYFNLIVMSINMGEQCVFVLSIFHNEANELMGHDVVCGPPCFLLKITADDDTHSVSF